jgi:hypothetical protein
LFGSELSGELLDLEQKWATCVLNSSPASGAGSKHEHAPVGGVWAALNEPVALEAIGDPGHRAGGQAEGAASVTGGYAVWLCRAYKDEELKQSKSAGPGLGDEITLNRAGGSTH